MNRMTMTSGFNPRSNQGFSTIEALISFVVLAVGLVALLSFHGTTQKSNAEAKVQAEAVAFAEEKLQELESFLTTGDTRLNVGQGSDTPAGQLLNFTRSWDIADDATNPDLTIAEVTVAWNDRDGNAQSVILNSAINRVNPPDSVTNFMAVAMAANDAENGGGGGGGGSWVDDGEVGGPDDPDDPVDPEDPVEPEDPPPVPVITVYTLTISGTLSGANGAQFQDADGFEDVAADPELLYPTTCTNTKSNFNCTAQYNSNSPGWSGDVVLKSNKNMYRSGSGSCSGASKTLTITFDGISQNQTLSIIAC